MKQSKKLELALLNYFLLITIAAMMIGVEFYFEMSKPGLVQEICATPTALNEITVTDTKRTSNALSNLRNKIVVMFGVLTVVMAIVMTMFVKNITRPLQRTLNTARLINDGDLSQVIKIEHHDEVGQLGTVINELTSNFQEIATSTSMMIKEIDTSIEELSDSPWNELPKNAEHITTIKQELEALRAFVESFNLLKTDIEN